jgi:hypothetical protein
MSLRRAETRGNVKSAGIEGAVTMLIGLFGLSMLSVTSCLAVAYGKEFCDK